MSADNNIDMVVIGGGAGGVAAAVRARQLGARTVVAEREHLGGICMNRGCIPTKTLIETARLYRTMQKANQFGLNITQVAIDWDALMTKKNEIVKYLRLGTESLLRSNGVEILSGEAFFTGLNRLQIGNQKVQTKFILLATGSCWSPLPMEGGNFEEVINADDILSMREVPSKVAVLGSGMVELELAQYLCFLGSKIILLEEENYILPGEDHTVSHRMTMALRNQKVEIQTQIKVLEIVRENSGLTMRIGGKNGERLLTVDRILYTKRIPCLNGVKIHAAGLKPSKQKISVDNFLRTSIPHIFAIGDVTGEPMCSHRASAMGILAVENAFGKLRSIDVKTIPRAYYTTPEVASVGLTEEQAVKEGYAIKVGTIPYNINSKAMILQETHGSVKVVADSKYGQILGVHIVGPNATELISEGALALKLEATLEDVADSVRYHPSLSESQADAAREALGRGIYVRR